MRVFVLGAVLLAAPAGPAAACAWGDADCRNMESLDRARRPRLPVPPAEDPGQAKYEAARRQFGRRRAADKERVEEKAREERHPDARPGPNDEKRAAADPGRAAPAGEARRPGGTVYLFARDRRPGRTVYVFGHPGPGTTGAGPDSAAPGTPPRPDAPPRAEVAGAPADEPRADIVPGRPAVVAAARDEEPAHPGGDGATSAGAAPAGGTMPATPAGEGKGPAAARAASPVGARPLAVGSVAPAAKPAPAVPAPPPAGGWAVQVAAVRDPAEVPGEWRRVAARHPGVAGLAPREPQAVEVPGRGRFWRVLAGSFATRAEAEAACARVRAGSGACRALAP